MPIDPIDSASIANQFSQSVTGDPIYNPYGVFNQSQFVGSSIGATNSVWNNLDWKQRADKTWKSGFPHPFQKMGLWQVGAIRARSGARTITQGGWMDAAQEKAIFDANPKGLGAFSDIAKRVFYENFHPKSLWRGPSTKIFEPGLPGIHNRLLFKKGKDAGGEPTWFGRQLEKTVGKSKIMQRSGLFSKDAEGAMHINHIWDPGVLQRYSAAGDWAKTKGELSDTQRDNLEKFLRNSNNEKLADVVKNGEKLTGADAASLTRLSMTGAFSGRLSGAFEALRGVPISDAVKAGVSEATKAGLNMGESMRKYALDDQGEKIGWRDLMDTASKRAAGELGDWGVKYGIEEGAKVAIAKTVGARIAVAGAEMSGAVGEAGLNPIMDILAIEGLAKLGLSLGKAAFTAVGHEVGAAATSFRGQIGKAPFGSGYRDTTAAATTRARAIQAIQISRLNLRNVIGNEASLVRTYYQ